MYIRLLNESEVKILFVEVVAESTVRQFTVMKVVLDNLESVN